MLRAYCVLLILFWLTGCGQKAESLDEFKTMPLTFPGGQQIRVEPMIKEMDIMRGMMFRDSLTKDRGMLFVHTADENHPYWMYQVRIPLDIIWMDHSRRIVEIVANAPPCPSAPAHDCPSFGGHEKARYVLELAGGGAALYGLRTGDVVSF